jgi:tRNA G18 (ribose-2'-O)-methylase SpoU
VHVERVDDLADPRLADFAALNDSVTRRRVERGGGYFVVEGMLALEQLCASRHPIRLVLVADHVLERATRVLRDRTDATVLVAPPELIATIAGFAFHRGVLASADRIDAPPAADVLAAGDLVCVTEGINDHENLGALFRNVAGLGGCGVLLDPTTADPLYRRSIRVSLGHVLRLPWTRLPSWPAALREVGDAGFTVVALTPDRDATPLHELAAERPPRVALLVGAEGPGLSDDALSSADRRVRIPLAPGVDSLNVATAAAIALYALGA